jgi:hypothetical protein
MDGTVLSRDQIPDKQGGWVENKEGRKCRISGFQGDVKQIAVFWDFAPYGILTEFQRFKKT